MRAVIYLGSLKIVKTRYGQFTRGKRTDLEDVVAREVLKIPGFEEPTFPARYLGKTMSRSLQVQGKQAGRRDIIVCPKGIWKALPVAIKYKINKDPDFEIGSAGSSAKFLIAKQEREIEAKKRVERTKHRRPVTPLVEVKPKPEPEVKFDRPTFTESLREEKEEEEKKAPVSIESLDLSPWIVSSLKAAGIQTVADLPKGKKLLEVKGIGVSSALIIREAIKED